LLESGYLGFIEINADHIEAGCDHFHSQRQANVAETDHGCGGIAIFELGL
jgi:hypothetical protein